MSQYVCLFLEKSKEIQEVQEVDFLTAAEGKWFAARASFFLWWVEVDYPFLLPAAGFLGRIL